LQGRSDSIFTNLTDGPKLNENAMSSLAPSAMHDGFQVSRGLPGPNSSTTWPFAAQQLPIYTQITTR